MSPHKMGLLENETESFKHLFKTGFVNWECLFHSKNYAWHQFGKKAPKQ